MSTLADRIEEILRLRGITQRELARRAGLATEQHINTILRRLRANPDADIERETLAAIARGGGVSFIWLATGKGRPDDIDPAPAMKTSERAPERSSAIGATSERYYVDDDLQWCIDQAWNRDRHLPADIRSVLAFGQKRGPLLRRDADMIELVGGWLNVAASLRERNLAVDYRSMIDELTRSRVEREHLDAHGRSEDDIRGEHEHREQTGRMGDDAKRDTLALSRI